MSDRRILDTSASAAAVQQRIANFHRRVLDEVVAAVESEPVVVVGMSQNPHVRRARRALDAAGVTFRYLEYGSYVSAWRERLAIKMWSGWPTFPQVFVDGALVGGADEMVEAIAQGRMKSHEAA